MPNVTLSEFMISDKDRQHPLKRVMQHMKGHNHSASHQASRGIVRMVKQHSHRSRRNDVRSAIARGRNKHDHL
jgi:uncharacterized protein (DUF2267 family)